MDPDTQHSVEALLRHSAWMRRLARQLTKGEHHAADVEQQTWLQALRHPPAHASNLRAWVARVMGNVVRRERRDDERRRRCRTDSCETTAQPATDDLVERAELHHRLTGMVLQLKEPYRTTVLLRFFEDLSMEEIAHRQGVPIETVRTRLKRSLQRLRAPLQKEFGESWALILLHKFELDDMTLTARTATTGTAATLTGGLAMSMLGKWSVGVVVMAVAAIAVVQWKRSTDSEVAPTTLPQISGAFPELSRDVPAPDPSPAVIKLEVARDPPAPAPTISNSPPSLFGTVTDRNGFPVPDATIIVGDVAANSFLSSPVLFYGWMHRHPDEPQVGENAPRRAQSDATGGYRIEAIETGRRLGFGAHHPQFGSFFCEGIVLDPIATERQVDCVLDGVVLRGRVVLDADSSPVADARMVISPGEKVANGYRVSGSIDLRTDEQGEFCTLPIAARFFDVNVIVDDANLQANPAGQTVEIPEGQHEHAIELRLKPRSSLVIRGDILGLDGRRAHLAEQLRAAPWIRGFSLCSFRQDPRSMPNASWHLETQGSIDLGQDTYEIALLHAEYTFLALWADRVLLGVAELINLEQRTDLVIDLAAIPSNSRKGSLLVEALDALTGEPLTHYKLCAQRSPRTEIQGAFKSYQWDVDNDGNGFETPLLPSDRYLVCARSDGRIPAWTEVDLKTGSEKTPVKLALDSRRGEIEGVVLAPDGKTVSGASVCLARANGTDVEPFGSMAHTTTIDGCFQLSDAPVGPLFVIASSDLFAPVAQQVEVEVDDTLHLELYLVEGMTVQFDVEGVENSGPYHFRILDARGAPLVDYGRRNMQSYGSGFNFLLESGSYIVEIFSPFYEVARREFSAPPELRVVIPMLPARR